MNTAESLNAYKTLFSPSLKKSTSLILERGEGSFLYASDGKKYLDFVQGIAVNALGHCHPKLIEAAQSQMKQMGHVSFNLASYPVVIDFASRLSEITPQNLDMFFFTNSGAEAVEGALKLARYVNGKSSIIAFRGGFHGRTMGAASVTSSNSVFRKNYAPFMPQVYFAPYPYCYRCPFSESPDACDLECLKYLEQDLDYIIPAEDVGAVLVEPVQGEGGYVVPPKKYMQALRSFCDKYGLLLIFDEIQSGIGRTGKMFAAEHFDVIPDIMTMGKAVGGGYPMAIVASSPEVMSIWQPGSHGTTFGGHPVAAAAGLAQLDLICEKGFLDQVILKGNMFRDGLNLLKDRFACIGDVRGLGLMNGVELVKDDGGPDSTLASDIVDYFHDHQTLVFSCGVKGNVIRFIPALNIEELLLEQVIDLFGKALKAVGK